jgi:hypothetical protein
MNLPWQGIPTEELRNFLHQSLPSAAILHSYLVRVRWDPALKEIPPMAQFSENVIHELHHQMGLWGAILRLNMGDPTAVDDVGLNLARFIHRRQAAMALVAQFPLEVRQNPQVRAVLSAINESNAEVEAYWPLLRQTLAATCWSDEHAMS